MASLKFLAESLVRRLEFSSIIDHVLDVGGRELANGVGDGDVGRTARGLLGSGDLEDTVDVDLEDDLKDGITSLHGRNGSKSELAIGHSQHLLVQNTPQRFQQIIKAGM